VVHIEEGQYAAYDLDSWRELSALRSSFRTPDQDWIRAVGYALQAPRVIRLVSCDRGPRQGVRFNRRNVFARDANQCQYCGRGFPTSELSLVHVVPRSRGGSTTWENIVCACVACNVRKGGRTPAEARMRILEGRRRQVEERREGLRQAVSRATNSLDRYTRQLHQLGLESSEREVNWLNDATLEETENHLKALKLEHGKKVVVKKSPFDFPNRLWESLVLASEISLETKWADLSKKQLQHLALQLTNSQFQVNGKSTFKEEFVTAGGIDLKEINFKTMESKLLPNVFFAGEILNIDAITGGFNFQNAWTGGFLVSDSIVNAHS
jgi:5-methylcytosine-specific restriction endonuclease McrA